MEDSLLSKVGESQRALGLAREEDSSEEVAVSKRYRTASSLLKCCRGIVIRWRARG